MPRNLEDYVGVLFTVMILYFLSYAPALFIAEKECLEKGYLDSTVDFTYSRYCIKTFGDITEVHKL